MSKTVAFTQNFPCIKDKLFTKLSISSKDTSLPNGAKTEIQAQWDTGASMSAISKELVKMMELPVVSMTNIGTAGGIYPTTIHIIDLQLPNGDVIDGLRVVAADIQSSAMLIGMDVISKGDFAISNFKGKTILNFRIPSYADIDFAEMAKNSQTIRVPKKIQRNAPCPCGSGRKYKNCHGR